MPKATLTFDLPDEQLEFHRAAHADDLSLVLFDMDQWLREQIKHNPNSYNEDQINLLETVRGLFHEYMTDRGIDLDLI